MAKMGLLVINELWKNSRKKKRPFCPHLPSKRYNFEMAFLVYLGVLRFAGEKVVTDCDIMRVDEGMRGGYVMLFFKSWS